MADTSISLKIEDLSDLELAMLLSLTSSQHAIIQTDESLLEDLQTELILAARQTFGLTCVSTHCTPETALDDFTQSMLVPESVKGNSLDYASSDGTCIPNVIIIRDLHSASRTIQMQAMELLKSRRMFTHTAVHSAPKHFLMLLVSATDSPPLVNHLRDFIYLSHVHSAEDGFPNMLDAPSMRLEDDDIKVKPLITIDDIDSLAIASNETTISVDVMRYIQDIAVFLRMHRAVAAGATPLATQHFVTMCKSLACLHGIRYVTPSLVTLAANKVFPHRIVFVTPATERSLQYGSDKASIAAYLDSITPEMVVEDVLATVECPL